MSGIGTQHVESVSLRGDVVCVSVRYEEPEVVGFDGDRRFYRPAREIDIDHEEDLGDRSIVTAVEDAVQNALDKAGAVLAGWGKATA